MTTQQIMHFWQTYLGWLPKVARALPTIWLELVLVLVTFLILRILLRGWQAWQSTRQSAVFVELTPPAHTDRLPVATQQLFMALYGLGLPLGWWNRLFGYPSVFALEIVSTRQQGIRFLIRVPEDKVGNLEHTIHAYLPDVRLKTVDDYLSHSLGAKYSQVVEFKQAEHFAYPLQGHELLESHDPIAYITSAMTKLASDELVSFQVLISPRRVRKAETLRRKILSNEDLLPELSGHGASVAGSLFHGINTVLFGITGAVGTAYHGPSKVTYSSAQKDLAYQQQVAKRIKPARTLSYFEQELIESIHHKLAQHLFKANVRVLLVMDSKDELKQRQQSIQSALNLFSVPKYQRFKASRTRYGWWRQWQTFQFRSRLLSPFRSPNLLAASELSSLYHFPHSVMAKTENVIKSLSKTLPAPVSLKNGHTLDILLGENTHHGSVTPLGLTASERERHVYIIGGTGNGKTTMLLYAIVQDIQNGKGVAILDPHGDLAETILRHVPAERIKDIIYLNPDDLTHPIGINLLELTPGLTGDDLLREKDLITESTISVLRKIFSDDDTGGHRIEYVLRNTIQTALTIEGATLFTIFRLLTNTKYRKTIIKTLQDEDLKNFWNNELGKAGGFQQVKMSAGITAKIGRFLFSASARRMLEQEKSTIDFSDILDSKKILICNFSKGLLGEDTSTLFGTTVLAKLQVAALRRARLKQIDRNPYYLYVDEFQNFATMSFVQMLSEARKYKLFLTMAEQSTSQQDQQRLVDIILANVGTVICFRSGSPADERYVLPLFSPYIEQGEIANLPAYNFYARIAAIQAQEPMSGSTVLLDNEGSETVASSVVEYTRAQYGVRKDISEKPLVQASQPVLHITAQQKKVTTPRTKKVQGAIPTS